MLAAPAFAAHVRRSAVATTHHARRLNVRYHRRYHHRYRRYRHRIRGQQAIDPDRVTQIQQALIRAHYLSGEPTGKWDATTIAAMRKFQADHGWQTRLTPDSRALEKLGLGPDYSDAINAKNSTAPSPAESAIPPEQEAGFAAASGVASADADQ